MIRGNIYEQFTTINIKLIYSNFELCINTNNNDTTNKLIISVILFVLFINLFASYY